MFNETGDNQSLDLPAAFALAQRIFAAAAILALAAADILRLPAVGLAAAAPLPFAARTFAQRARAAAAIRARPAADICRRPVFGGNG